MAASRLFKFDFLALFVLVSYFSFVSCGRIEGQTEYRQCLSGTPECSHGKCLEGLIRTSTGIHRERECVCDAKYFGKDCTIYISMDFNSPIVIRSRGRNLDEERMNERDALALSIAYGGHQ
uniref:EGF-like domain-containing protein n=1 Tax=Schistocephalus solidus TaxID=70667 RepID=A0A0X3PZ90_SCHSO